MSTARNYLWMSFDDIIADASERVKDITNHEIPVQTIAAWASQACREFARRAECVRGTELRPLIREGGLYRLPVDCIRVREVAIRLPGFDGELALPYLREEEILDSAALPTGTPWAWYLTPDRLQLGLIDIPSTGGFDGYTTANGAGGGGTVIASALAPGTNVYVGMQLIMLEGVNQDEVSTITAYDGVTKTVTVTPSFGATVVSNLRFQIYPDTVRVEYVRGGNTCSLFPTTVYELTGTLVSNFFNSIMTTIPQSQKDFWIGREVRFTAGNLIGERARILSSIWDSTVTGTRLGIFPELKARPTGLASDSKFVVTEVPNIPDSFHSAIVDYIVHLALVRNGTADPQHYQVFLDKVGEALRTNLPVQGMEFEQVKQFATGEFELWEE